MEKNSLNEVSQSAYKNKHSTETALLKVKDDITRAQDENHAAFLIMLDLSAAFDTIDHGILFQRFEHDFGIKGTALKWFKSYITGRKFRVCIGGEMSDDFILNYGVPQGSIIGPRAFTKYSQCVTTIIHRYGLRYHIYADDIQLYSIFDPKIPGDAAVAIFKLSCCVEDIRSWMNQNKLKLNDSKTEFFIATSSQNMNRLTDTTIRIGTTEISPAATIRNLGVVFDSNMTMSSHITSLCKSVNFILWNISRIRKFIDQDTCNTLMRTLVLSKLDYANALLLGCKQTDISRLQRLHNKAACIIYQVPRFHSTSVLLNNLHWLPINKRILFKILMYIYKCINDLAPVYLADSISLFTPSREGLRSSMDTTRLSVARSNRKYGAGSFSLEGPKLWNNIPCVVRTSPTIMVFKTSLKGHLF